MVDDVITDLEIAVLCDLLDGPSVNLKAHRRSVLNMADVPRSWPRRGEAPGSVRRGKIHFLVAIVSLSEQRSVVHFRASSSTQE